MIEIKPVPVSDVFLAFPASVRDLMPDYDDELRAWAKTDEGRKWEKVQNDWFGSGLANVQVDLKDGIDGKDAWRHLQAIQGSFEPKHEHKMAAVAYLMSQWFNAITYDKMEKTHG